MMILSIDEMAGEPRRDVLAERRAMVERMAELAKFLPEPENRIVRGMLVHGRPLTQVARRLGMDWMAAKRIYRRVIRRMSSRHFRRAVRHFAQLNPAEQELARRAVFAGQSLRQVARTTGISLHMVRKQLPGLLAKLARLEEDGTKASGLRRQPGLSLD